MSKSIIQPEKKRCYLCGRLAGAVYGGLDEHHVFGGSNRQLSERYGLKVYLCHFDCHLNGVHKHATINNALKAEIQTIAMNRYNWTTEDFIKIFGKNYIMED